MDRQSFTRDLTSTSLFAPSTGFIASGLSLKDCGAKFSPLTTTQAKTEPAKSAAKTGKITSIELVIFVLKKFIKALLLAKMAF